MMAGLVDDPVIPDLGEWGEQLGRLATHIAEQGRELLDRPLLLAAGIALLTGLAVARAVIVGQIARWRHERLHRGARILRLLPPPQADPAGAHVVWTHLAAIAHPAWKRLLYGQPHLAWEYTWTGRTAQISLWIPGTIPPALVQRAISAAWPGTAITTEPATTPLPANNSQLTVGGGVRLARPQPYPLATGQDIDPLRALFEAAADTRDREHVVVQILARPLTGARVRSIDRAATRRARNQPLPTRHGLTVVAGLSLLLTGALSTLLDLIEPSTRPTGRAAVVPAGLDPARSGQVRAILDKSQSPVWETQIRYAITTPVPKTSNTAVTASRQGRARGRAHTIAAAFAVHTGPHNGLVRVRLARPAATIADRRLRRGDLLSAAELAGLAHLPVDQTVPGLSRAGAKAIPAPIDVPTGGRNTKMLGDAEVGGHAVALPVADARQHLHVIGATGSGKSTLLLNMILADISAGRGVAVIDPKGDLVLDILDRLPLSVADKVVLLDPDQKRPPRLNPLEGGDPDLVVDNLVGIFSKIFQRHWGPRMDDVLRAACLTLLTQPGQATLEHVPQLLNDKGFRATAVAGIDDPAGLGGFWTWYDEMPSGPRSQAVGPVLARLRAFLLRDFARTVVGKPRKNSGRSIDMDRILNGGILLARIPKGILGDDTTKLLGSFVVARAWQAATARTRIPEQQRKDCAVYIDECHNFLTLPRAYDEMLAEARGYRMSLVLAHQDLAQLSRELRDALSANARTKLVFNVSPEDARLLAHHTQPELTDHDLSHLGAYTAAARLLVGNRETPAFTLRTRPAPPVLGHRTEIRAIAATSAKTAPEKAATPTSTEPDT